MQTSALIVIVYGLLVLAGGVMGYVKAKSLPSLISGILFGVLLLISGVGIQEGAKLSFAIALALTVVLMLIMGLRFVKSKKFMPAGLITLLSAITALLLMMEK